MKIVVEISIEITRSLQPLIGFRLIASKVVLLTFCP